MKGSRASLTGGFGMEGSVISRMGGFGMKTDMKTGGAASKA